MTSSRHEFLDGFRLIVPILIAQTPFGFIVGATSVQKGLSVLEATIMSATVFAGAGQMLALEVWHQPKAWLLVMLAAASVNIRFLLQTASIGPKISHFPPFKRWLAAIGWRCGASVNPVAMHWAGEGDASGALAGATAIWSMLLTYFAPNARHSKKTVK